MTIKEAAQFYIDKGMRPMPIYGIESKCQHKPIKPGFDCKGQCWGKVPIHEHWPDKIFTPDDFDDDCNLALIMGKQTDGRWLLGIDIDGEYDLRPSMFAPDTLECKTNRGKHLIYQVEADMPLGNWADIFGTLAPTGYKWSQKGSVDLKYARGAMVSPPSLTKTGGTYEWKQWREPAILPQGDISYMIRRRAFFFPKAKRFKKWSFDPKNFGKKP